MCLEQWHDQRPAGSAALLHGVLLEHPRHFRFRREVDPRQHEIIQDGLAWHAECGQHERDADAGALLARRTVHQHGAGRIGAQDLEQPAVARRDVANERNEHGPHRVHQIVRIVGAREQSMEIELVAEARLDAEHVQSRRSRQLGRFIRAFVGQAEIADGADIERGKRILVGRGEVGHVPGTEQAPPAHATPIRDTVAAYIAKVDPALQTHCTFGDDERRSRRRLEQEIMPRSRYGHCQLDSARRFGHDRRRAQCSKLGRHPHADRHATPYVAPGNTEPTVRRSVDLDLRNRIHRAPQGPRKRRRIP